MLSEWGSEKERERECYYTNQIHFIYTTFSQINFNLAYFKPMFMYSDMHKDLCRGTSGLCDAMRPTKGADLLKYLRKVNFTGT